MELEFIEKNWDIAIVDTDAARRLWGLYARRPEQKPEPSSENSLPLRIVTENRMIDADSRVLDVGCGTGRFSLWFAERCAHVTGLDFSTDMLDEARRAAAPRQLTNIDFVCENWHELQLEAHGWENRFHLVFANMSPAVQSARTFAMLTRASCAWCLMAKPTRREDGITEYLLQELGVEWYHRPFDVDMVYAFSWLSLKGYLPKVDYFSARWERSLPLDEATDHFTAWLGMNYPLTGAQKEGIRPALERIARDGVIDDCSDVTVPVLYWHV